MSTENTTTADRLLTDARKKTARQESSKLGTASLVVGIIALLVSPISIAGWVLGATALGLGAGASRRPVSGKQAKIAMVLGVAAILVGVFFYTLNIARF
jgi:hypothetical protein